MSNKINIALLQHAAPPSEPSDSVLKRGEQIARAAKSSGARIIRTQKLFAGSYFRPVDARGGVTQLFQDGVER
jgi:hypothetical protein